MFSFSRQGQLKKLQQAIEKNELQTLVGLLRKTSPEKLAQLQQETGCNLLQQAILQGAVESVERLLQHHGEQTLPLPEKGSYLMLALQQENSLSLLGKMLPSPLDEPVQPLLAASLKSCSVQQLMLHISLLVTHGVSLTDEVMLHALQAEDKALIHFLIESGAEIPADQSVDNSSDEALNYARKCQEDKKIREMFLD